MKCYEILPLGNEFPELTGNVFDPEMEDFCEETPFAPIDSYVWTTGSGYTPEARAYVRWSPAGLHVLMCALEREIIAQAKNFNDAVCRDSCLEFFLQPLMDDPRYLNIEVNAAGVAHIGLGEERHGRTRLPALPEGMNICASRHRGGWWAVSYIVPTELIRSLYGRVPAPGDTMRGNFYTCDETIHPHFGTWSPVVHFQPDFHRPEWFGELRLIEK